MADEALSILDHWIADMSVEPLVLPDDAARAARVLWHMPVADRAAAVRGWLERALGTPDCGVMED